MGKGKPRGLNAARKLQNHRREQRWADLHYKKRLLGTAFKSSPFGGSSHAKGIVLEKVGVEAKQPNSAIRKCVRLVLGNTPEFDHHKKTKRCVVPDRADQRCG